MTRVYFVNHSQKIPSGLDIISCNLLISILNFLFGNQLKIVLIRYQSMGLNRPVIEDKGPVITSDPNLAQLITCMVLQTEADKI